MFQIEIIKEWIVATEPQKEIIQWNRRTQIAFINGGAGIGGLVITG